MRSIILILVSILIGCGDSADYGKNADEDAAIDESPEKPGSKPSKPGSKPGRDAGEKDDAGFETDAGFTVTEQHYLVTRSPIGIGCPTGDQVTELAWDMVQTEGRVTVQGENYAPANATDGRYVGELEGELYASGSGFNVAGTTTHRDVLIRAQWKTAGFTATESSDEITDCQWALVGELQ